MIVLETALPAKFEATIQEALNQPAPCAPSGFEGIEAPPKRFQVVPADVGHHQGLHR